MKLTRIVLNPSELPFMIEKVKAKPELQELYDIIGQGEDRPCEMVELVKVWWQGQVCHMFVDEDGISKRLLPNHAASLVYAQLTMSGKTGEPITTPVNPIFGTAVLYNTTVW